RRLSFGHILRLSFRAKQGLGAFRQNFCFPFLKLVRQPLSLLDSGGPKQSKEYYSPHKLPSDNATKKYKYKTSPRRPANRKSLHQFPAIVLWSVFYCFRKAK